MPESSRRKKKSGPSATPAASSSSSRVPVKLDGARWIAPAMVAMFVIGLLWIVTWYIAPTNPLMNGLGSWNVAVGFVFIAVGFLLSTKWK